MSPTDRAALVAAGLLATWTNLAINLVIWGGLFLTRAVPLAPLNYWLSLWPVLVDIVILMATMALTRQQMHTAASQTAVLDALHVLVVRQQTTDAHMEELLAHMHDLDRGDALDLDEVLAFVRSLGPVRRDLDRLLAAHHLEVPHG